MLGAVFRLLLATALVGGIATAPACSGSSKPVKKAKKGKKPKANADARAVLSEAREHAKGGEYLLSRSLASLECELDPTRFFRIHRSAIVNSAYVREVMSRGDGRYNVYLQGGEALPLGRARRDMLHRLLGGIHAKKSGGPRAAANA